MPEKTDLRFSFFPSLFFLLFSVLLKASGLSMTAMVNFQNDLMKKAFIETAGMGTYQSILLLIKSYAFVFLSLVFLAAALAFISSYGAKKRGYENSLVAAGIGCVSLLFFLGISLMTLFLCAAVIAATLIAAKQSEIYFDELKKWRYFRTGSRSISSSLFVFNIIVALGALIAVSTSQQFYAASFREDLKNTITEIALKDFDQQLKPVVESRIEAALENSSLIEAYIRWLPVVTAVAIWLFLEIARIFVANLGGVFTHFILKYSE